MEHAPPFCVGAWVFVFLFLFKPRGGDQMPNDDDMKPSSPPAAPPLPPQVPPPPSPPLSVSPGAPPTAPAMPGAPPMPPVLGPKATASPMPDWKMRRKMQEEAEERERLKWVKKPCYADQVVMRAINAQEKDTGVNQSLLRPIVEDDNPQHLHVVGFDMDGTLNYHDAEHQTTFLGGQEAMQDMEALLKRGDVVKIISATRPGDGAVGSLNVDLAKLGQVPLSLLGDDSAKPKFNGATKRVALPSAQGKQEYQLSSHRNIMLARYDKGAAMAVAVKEKLESMDAEKRDNLTKIHIHFIDDFIENPFNFARQLQEHLSVIKELCPNAEIAIDSIWLQVPIREHSAKAGVKTVNESSYQKKYEPLAVVCTEKGTVFTGEEFEEREKQLAADVVRIAAPAAKL